MRRPDLAFFSQAQIRVGAGDAEPVPAFVVEIISPSDRAEGGDGGRLARISGPADGASVYVGQNSDDVF